MDHQGKAGNSLQVIGQVPYGQFFAAVFGQRPGNHFGFGFGNVERGAFQFTDQADHSQYKTSKLR